jgi:signal transduction histidine kinase
MDAGTIFAIPQAAAGRHYSRALRNSLFLSMGLVACSLLAGTFLTKGLLLAAIGDLLQVGLIATATILAFQNFFRSHANVRSFWLLIFVGAVLWLASLVVWSVYEVWLQRPDPDLPAVDILLFVKLVPLTAALALDPHASHDSRSRTFGILDVSILMIYSLYLYTFYVYAYRLLPGAVETYNYHFNLADATGNQIFTLAAAYYLFRAQGPWRWMFRIYFLAAALFGLASDLGNVAMDQGGYYTGSLYDVPLMASIAAFLCFCLLGRALLRDQASSAPALPRPEELHDTHTFYSSYFAMLVTLSTPVIGIWLLTRGSTRELFAFRLVITLATMFILTLLLSIKQDVLAASLIGTFQRLSETYSTIDRFKSHLRQSEKLTSLGELVAQIANQIKGAMTNILALSVGITLHADTDPRIPSMAGKISQYAQRTDALVQNMLRFAQETPLEIVSVEVKPLIESALNLSRVSKLPNIRVALNEDGPSPLVRGDSSQLLHVFLQIIANAVDALEEVGGGTLDISISPSSSRVSIQFADSGRGIQEPEHLFEPFYTTKPVGKGTGLGLSTCYGIIQQHDGEITARNRARGGAVFVILLPAAASANIVSADSAVPAVEEAK